MADKRELAKRIGLTRGKAMLIGILAVILVVAIYMQYGPVRSADAVAANETTIAAPPPPRRPSAAPALAPPIAERPAPADEPSEQAARTLDANHWKAPDLESIVQYDPFALPPSFPHSARVTDGKGLTAESLKATDAAARASLLADEVAKLHTALEELRQRGVSVIVKQNNQYVAMIGDRTIHVGEEINGFTVTAIEPDGVHVEKKVTE